MEAPLDTNFLIRRITQLWVEAADLPDRSPAQAHIEELACKLSDYVSKLAENHQKSAGPAAPDVLRENAEHCPEGCRRQSVSDKSM
jgi:hypothetical protein